MKAFYAIVLSALLMLGGCSDNPTQTQNPKQDTPTPDDSSTTSPSLECTDGKAAGRYPCHNVDLLAKVPIDTLMATPLEDGLALNDIWGWTDPQTGKEYALVGLNDGVTFVDVSSPREPEVIGKLNEPDAVASTSGKAMLHHEGKSSWRDFKVYKHYLYVVSDAQPHGMQVFDLAHLRDVEDPPVTFSEDALYTKFGNAHNIVINPDEPYAYVAGSNTFGGGLHIVDISSPLNPQLAGSQQDTDVGRDSTGYVHDAQCVTYHGPDEDYQGDEICMNSSETHLLIANVTDKQHTYTISKATYASATYVHQGWLTEDQRYFLLDDELDEWDDKKSTRTYIWDVRDLDNPKLIGTHHSNYASIDHNQYVKGNYVYQTNYTAGLHILSLDNVADGKLQEVGFFDTYPLNSRAEFRGTWSSYPYFKSGIVIVSDMTRGLFILKPTLE